ncbi:dUTP diphosphatase [Metamycoplasma hominis]|nr:dUTP diphosphatase [Metamycoplasma hominis]AKJ52346.1 dUTPase [Metamycoplasma hominis]
MELFLTFKFIIQNMNLTEVFEAQKKLDLAFANSIEKTEFLNIKIKMVIALLVELGEFANEVKLFKYWKKDKSINQISMLEEYADGIHFITSIALKNNITSFDIKPIIKYNDFTLQLAYTYQCFTKLFLHHNKRLIKKAYGVYLGLGEIMNIDRDMICTAYAKKNHKNYERIKNNY